MKCLGDSTIKSLIQQETSTPWRNFKDIIKEMKRNEIVLVDYSGFITAREQKTNCLAASKTMLSFFSRKRLPKMFTSNCDLREEDNFNWHLVAIMFRIALSFDNWYFRVLVIIANVYVFSIADEYWVNVLNKTTKRFESRRGRYTLQSSSYSRFHPPFHACFNYLRSIYSMIRSKVLFTLKTSS